MTENKLVTSPQEAPTDYNIKVLIPVKSSICGGGYWFTCGSTCNFVSIIVFSLSQM